MAHTSGWKSKRFILKTTGCNHQIEHINQDCLACNPDLVTISHIGIAVKDLSHFKSYYSEIVNSPICIELFQKKQEFGGAIASFDNLECKGEYIVDSQSVLNY